MNRGPLRRQGRAARYPGLELATVLEVEPAELLRVPVPKDDLGRDKLNR
jgi:hypothetical protein